MGPQAADVNARGVYTLHPTRNTTRICKIPTVKRYRECNNFKHCNFDNNLR